MVIRSYPLFQEFLKEGMASLQLFATLIGKHPMTRVKRGVQASRKRKRLLKHTKGFMWTRKSKERQAREALLHAWTFQFADRKKKISDDCSAIGLSANSKFLYLRGTKTPVIKINVEGEKLWESNVVAGRIPVAPERPRSGRHNGRTWRCRTSSG